MEQELTVAAAARRLNLTLDAIYRLVYAGRIVARKEQRRWLIPSSAVQARLKARGLPMEPLAVDVREAGRLLSLSPRTIRRHIKAGRIQALRIGSRVLVPVEALMEILRQSDGSLRETPMSMSAIKLHKISGNH
jgi:excisionase family DNA binding protein